ncbi:DUF11 domain-containing protein, partial [Flavobacterium salilacus subsp. salilacus]|uniref:choice-of-anchor L domain-containing protein n=2 Tax=Flavobacterium TaxID=237 RepID=UPI0010750D38
MKKLLLTLLLVLGAIGLRAQSEIVVFNTNPDYEYTAGQTLTFSVMVTNNGPDPAQNVNVFYPIPPGIVITAGITRFWWEGTNGSTGTNVALNNTIPVLGVNETVTYTINIKIPGSFGNNNTLPEIEVTYNTQSDIEIMISDNQDNYILGGQSVYAITVVNNGPEVASEINVLNAIPSGITSFSWTGSNGSSGTNVNLSNSLENLPIGQVVTYTVTLDVPAFYTGSLTSTVSATGSYTDPNPACTTCTDTDLPPVANVVVVNTNNQQYYTPGTQSVYTLTVSNVGPQTANNIIVSNVMPAGITSFSWTGDNGSSGTGDLSDVISTLAVGEIVTYTITLDVPVAYTGNLVSEASVTTGSTDPDVSCPQCTDVDTSSVVADIETIVTNGQGTYTAGSTPVYTVTVTNNGPATADNVTVDVAIPAGITSFSWTGDNGSSGTDVALQDVIATMAAGESVVYTITLDVPVAYNDPSLTVQAVVTSNTDDPDTACVQCSDTDYSPGTEADLVVTNTDSQATYTAATEVIYLVTVTNNGPATAQNVHVVYDIPNGISEYSWTASNGVDGDNVPLDVITPTLNSGESIIYSVTLVVPDSFSGNLVTEAVVTSDNDPDTSCTDCTDIDTQELSADIVVVNTNNQEVYTEGTTATYTVTVTNNGPTEAQNVVVQNAIPTDITSFSWTGSNGSSGTDVALDDTIPTLAVGETVTYTISLDVPVGYTDVLTSETTVTSDTTDPDTTCDECIDTDYSATADADLLITKTLASGDTYTAGADAVYTITVTNQGPGAATNVTVQDIVPAGLTAADATWYGNGTTGTGDLNDVIATMLPNTTVTYQFTIPVPSNFDQTTDIVNEVTVTSDTTDPTPDCPDCTHTATPNPQANLVTLKTDGQDTFILGQNVVYTITVTNPGPSDAYNVVVYDPIPYDIEILFWQGEGTSGEGELLTSVPVLPAGETLEYIVTIVVPEDYDDTVDLVNTVTVESDTPDPVPGCTTCTDTNELAEDFVTVDKYAYTVEELVEDILIEAECVDVSNITWSAGNIGGNFGIGYFEGNNSNFPIQDGIILRCGNAELSEGKYNAPVTSSVASGIGDAELLAVSQANGNFGTINDVTYLQFNFVPLTDTMSFDFLFASNEYGTYQCGFSDVFAFLLTDLTDGSVTNVNLAVIPGTTIPVSVTNIRNSLYNAGCPSANVTYFGQYNPANPANSAINMLGQTVVMTASSDVVAGHTYKIKLAIGDYNDTAFDSAVFIAAGSFDIGQPELPEDLTLVSGTALCEGDEYELSVASENPNFIYQWQYEGETILDDENNPVDATSITVTEAGRYTVLASFVSDPDCQLTDEILVEVIPEVEYNEPADLLFFSNGIDPVLFDLTENDELVLSGVPNSEFYYMQYFDSPEGLGTDEAIAIFPPYEYPGTDGQTIYATINNDASYCVTITSFELYVLTQPQDIFLCKAAPHDSQETFNLVAENSNILSTLLDPAEYTVTYHETLIGAQDGSEFIADPSNYTTTPINFVNNTQTLYVRVQDNNDPDAFAITPFDIIVSFMPTMVDLEPVSICELEDPDDIATFDLTDQVTEITNASPNLDLLITMHPTQADAEANVNPLTYPIYDTDETQNQTVYFRVIQDNAPDQTCITYIPLELIVNPAPTPVNPGNIQLCDTDNSGDQLFDLTSLDGAVLDGSDPNDYIVDYYLTLENAEDDANEITNPETYIAATGTTTLYVRLTNALNPECYGITSFDITITPTPVVEVPADASACAADDYILPLLPVGNYYTGSGGTGTMLSEGSVITSTQVIYVYAESGTIPNNCTDEGSFTVTIFQEPAVPSISDYEQCDYTGNTGEEEFDLTTKDQEVTQGDPDVIAQYYPTQEDAQADTNPITNPGTYTNSGTPQTIWAAAINTFGCRSVSSFNLIVHPLPETNPALEPFYACEEIPGEGQFDTIEIDAQITLGASGYTISYYDNPTSAQAGSDDYITTPFTAPTSTIYARVADELTGCYTIVPVELQVIPAPIAPEQAPLEECDFNNDNVATFNLDPVLQNISNTLGNVNVTIHETQDDATYSANPIPNTGNYTNVEALSSNGIQTLYIRVQSTQTQCFDIVTLQLIVHPVPVAAIPQDYALCDNGTNDTDGIATFDLTTKDEEVLNGMNPAQYSVSYYQTMASAQLGLTPINTPANYSSPSATIYVRVTNNATGCYDIVPLELIVNPLPVVNNPAPYTLCDINNPGDEQ